MLALIIGIAMAFNIIIILLKFKFGKANNALIDAALLVAVVLVCSGSTQLLIMGTVASTIVSLYLLAFPPTISKEHTYD